MLLESQSEAESWFEDRLSTLGTRSRNRAHSDMKRFLEWMSRHRKVNEDALDYFEPRKSEPLRTPLVYSSEDCQRLLGWIFAEDAVRPGSRYSKGKGTLWTTWHFSACLLLLLHCGLRRSEMALLSVDEVDLARKCLWVLPSEARDLKTENGRRWIPMSSALQESLALCTHGRVSGRVFPSIFMVPHCREIEKYSGLWVSSRKTRRTFATALASVDIPVRTLTMVMGHSSVKVTDRHYWGRARTEIPGLEIDRFRGIGQWPTRYDEAGGLRKDAV